MHINFEKTNDVLTEPWWVTVAGCLTFAALIALVLILV
jgi:hypothetical protein